MSELAILGGPKTRTEPYPQWPVWDQRDIDAVTEVIKSGRWGGYPYPGPKTAELAMKFSDRDVAGALHDGLIKRDDEIGGYFHQSIAVGGCD